MHASSTRARQGSHVNRSAGRIAIPVSAGSICRHVDGFVAVQHEANLHRLNLSPVGANGRSIHGFDGGDTRCRGHVLKQVAHLKIRHVLQDWLRSSAVAIAVQRIGGGVKAKSAFHSLVGADGVVRAAQAVANLGAPSSIGEDRLGVTAKADGQRVGRIGPSNDLVCCGSVVTERGAGCRQGDGFKCDGCAVRVFGHGSAGIEIQSHRARLA